LKNIGNISRRALFNLVTLAAVVTINFFLFRIVPGDPVAMIASPRMKPETQALLANTDDLTTRAQIYMADTEAYTTDLDELCRMKARFFVEQSDSKDGEA